MNYCVHCTHIILNHHYCANPKITDISQVTGEVVSVSCKTMRESKCKDGIRFEPKEELEVIKGSDGLLDRKVLGGK